MASLLASGVLFLACSGCGRDVASTENATLVHKLSPQVIEQAAAKKVVFAHQSVGNNILEGVGKLVENAGVRLSIVETRDPPSAEPGIYHFKVGENGKPKTKLDDFLHTLTTEDFSGADVALVKLCYLDFDESIDPAQVAQEYLDVLNSLQRKYPPTRFLAVTAPLTTIQTGPKAWIKKLLGKQPAGYESNALRQQFNQVLRERAPAGDLFDIARLESAWDGSPVSFAFEGKQVEALDPNLTHDGGHLNDTGQAVVAASFLELVAQPAAQSLEHPAGT
jgi:hypothetical protein